MLSSGSESAFSAMLAIHGLNTNDLLVTGGWADGRQPYLKHPGSFRFEFFDFGLNSMSIVALKLLGSTISSLDCDKANPLEYIRP